MDNGQRVFEQKFIRALVSSNKDDLLLQNTTVLLTTDNSKTFSSVNMCRYLKLTIFTYILTILPLVGVMFRFARRVNLSPSISENQLQGVLSFRFTKFSFLT